jgi:hypothetical protein
MCECGCTSNDLRYWFPAPDNDVYIITLTRGCVECDGASGVSIERISKGDMLWKDRRDYLDGKLKFEKWPDSRGVAIITGMLKHEFVKALAPHLIATDLHELDEIGAEVLLEEAYNDSVVKPHFPLDEK